MPPLKTRDRGPYWRRMFKSSAELEAMKDAAAGKVRAAYDATTRAIANGVAGPAGERDAPVDKFKVGMAAEMQKAAPASSKARAPAASPKREAARDFGASYVLDRIAAGEAPDQPVSYDTTFGYGRFLPAGTKPVSQLTLDELAAVQGAMKARQRGSKLPSTAVGKYQFLEGTLTGLRKKLNLTGDEVFSPELQDRLAWEMLEELRYSDFAAGKLDAKAFQRGLATRWASVADPDTGLSRYGQPVGTSTAQIQEALETARAEADHLITDWGADPRARGWR